MQHVSSDYQSPDLRIVVGDSMTAAGGRIRRPAGIAHWTFHYVLAGEAEFIYGNESVIVRPGDAILIEPGIPHNYRVLGKRAWAPIWAVFDAEPYLQRLLHWPVLITGHRGLSIKPTRERRHMEEKLREMIQVNATTPMYRDELTFNSLEAALFWMDMFNPLSDVHRPLDPRLWRAVNYVRQRMGQTLQVSDLCAAAGLSSAQLTRLFKQSLNQSPAQFIEKQRMDSARQLLAFSALTIQEIASKVGYRDPFYFSNRFRHATGISPRRYRRSSGQQ